MKKILLLSLIFIATSLSAQFNFEISKSLSDNFSEDLVTIAEEDGYVYLYDKDFITLVKYDVANDKYIQTGEDFYEEAGVVEPHSRFDQIEFITDDYLVVCYFNSRYEKDKNSSAFILYFDKNTLKFEKKLVHSFNMFDFKNNLTAGFKYQVSENRKYVSIQYKDIEDSKSAARESNSNYKFFVLNVDESDIYEVEDGSFLRGLKKDEFKPYYINSFISNEGDIYALASVENDRYYTSGYGKDSEKRNEKYHRALVKFSKNEKATSYPIDVDFLTTEFALNWNEYNQQLYYVAFGYIGKRDKDQSNIINAYSFFKFDKDLELEASNEEEVLDKDMVLEANQNIEYKEVPDNSKGLISFNLNQLEFIEETSILIFDHQVVTVARGDFAKLLYPSFLVLYIDENGDIAEHVLLKRWNSDGADNFAKKLFEYRILKSNDALYLLAYYNLRFEPFKGEKEFEKGQLAYCKISKSGVSCSNVLSFEDASYFGLINNNPVSFFARLTSGGTFNVNLRTFNLNQGDYVMKFQKESNKNVPSKFKKYKYFYGHFKLDE